MFFDYLKDISRMAEITQDNIDVKGSIPTNNLRVDLWTP